jgi:hypothetical protein
MEDKLQEEMDYVPSEEERQQRQYDKELRHIAIARARANVVRSQITQAYSILEDIRFDHLGDTAFRDRITKSKRALESALSDFLLSDPYWEKREKKMWKMSPAQYDAHLKEPAVSGGEDRSRQEVNVVN